MHTGDPPSGSARGHRLQDLQVSESSAQRRDQEPMLRPGKARQCDGLRLRDNSPDKRQQLLARFGDRLRARATVPRTSATLCSASACQLVEDLAERGRIDRAQLRDLPLR
jgi:hypothetical protein